ncbi:hypothetical protein PAXINDRAFT_15343 [Paxillus involutus ATCC 200175]|uniref:DUF6830 domain-containing protein n=1 Tax=Paxillus involutus ATCC 200175 TaxID=664439 RepID=A0A0C9T7W7_PAXIN|nr:hypothetical protein PAXINDRAFT_15343 [Paxillus involutus ATCC 200175]
MFNLPDLRPAIWEFLQRLHDGSPHPVSGARTQQQDYSLPFERLQIWCKVRVQQMSYHDRQAPGAPQTLRALPPSATNPHGLYNTVIISTNSESDWPRRGIEGHSVVQLRVIFHPLHSDILAAYVQHFNIVPQHATANNMHPGTGMHLLRRAVRSNGQRVGDVIPITQIRSPAHLIPNFVIPESTSQPGARMLQKRALLGPKPLTSHETPLAPACIQSVPPAYRHKSDWYQDHMDPLVDKDTNKIHWSLDQDESICLLDALFPDKKLFEESVQRGRLVPSPSGGMAAVLNQLGKPYGKGTKGKSCWFQFPMSSNSGAVEKKTTMEQKMAVFLNTVIEGLEAEVGPFKSKLSVPPTLVLMRTQQTDMRCLANEDLDWRDISIFGEMKSKKSPATIKESYIEVVLPQLRLM